VTISLPDVNVWVAMAAGGHVHHVPARDWFSAQPDASVALCRVTQMGLLRLLTNRSVMGQAPRTVGQAWEVFSQLRRDRRLLFLTEPDGVEPVWCEFMLQLGVGASSWTDAYLAAFARTHACMLVTFDNGFARWAGLDLKLLPVPKKSAG
jgi:toxin-antitoxin system PIN domain toxin